MACCKRQSASRIALAHIEYCLAAGWTLRADLLPTGASGVLVVGTGSGLVRSGVLPLVLLAVERRPRAAFVRVLLRPAFLRALPASAWRCIDFLVRNYIEYRYTIV